SMSERDGPGNVPPHRPLPAPAPPPLPRELRGDDPLPAPPPLPRELRGDDIFPAPPPLPRELRGDINPAPPPMPRELRSNTGTPSIVPSLEVVATIVADGLPRDLRNQLTELEEWATANKRDSHRDMLAFWSLKIPAILAAASAGVWAHFNLTSVSVITGAISS